MEGHRWERIQSIFHEAAALTSDARRAFVEAACGEDHELLEDVLACLEEDERGGSLLDAGVAQLACDLLDEPGGSAGMPESVGPYRIIRRLGSGGMGVVYLASRSDLESTVAIKVLRDANLSPARRIRFANEQRTLAQLNHPAIARIFDAGSLPDGTPYFVMECVEGEALTDYSRRRRISIRERLQLLRQVGEAVQHAHRLLVVHRDLKPSNILVRSDGQPKLLDFGIARHLDGAGPAVDVTRTGARLMTPAYAAPEQVRGEAVGAHTDIYSLGVILYELLTGRLPFDLSNRTPAEAERIITREEPVRPSAVASLDRDRRLGPDTAPLKASRAAWADLDVMCMTAMHKDPSRRYQSAESLIRDIDHYLAGEPLEARPDTFGYRARKFAGRNARSLAAAAALIVAVLASGAFYTARLTAARTEAITAAARAERIQRFMLALFDAGEKSVGPAEDLRVLSLLDRGVREAEGLRAEPAVQAALLETLGRVYQNIGKLDRADSLLQGSLDRRRALFGSEHVEVGASMIALALLRADQARFDDAERLAREGLAIVSQKARSADLPLARANVALAKVLEQRGAYKDATSVLEKAVEIYTARGESSEELAAALRGLSNNYFYTGQYAAASTYSQRALVLTQAIKGPEHPLVAADLINLGAVSHELGRYDDAERFYLRALKINEAWFGPDHHETASSLTMLGRTLRMQKRFDDASAALQRALTIQERVFGAVHPRVASVVNDIGNIASEQGRYDDAEASFTRMLAIYAALYPEKHYLLGIAKSNLANVHLARENYDRAEQGFREAIALFSDTLSPNHLNTGIARIKLGRTLLRQRRYAEAETESLAGYAILTSQTSPSVTWLRAAREDLAMVYDATGRQDQARRFRNELTETPAATR